MHQALVARVPRLLWQGWATDESADLDATFEQEVLPASQWVVVSATFGTTAVVGCEDEESVVPHLEVGSAWDELVSG